MEPLDPETGAEPAGSDPGPELPREQEQEELERTQTGLPRVVPTISPDSAAVPREADPILGVVVVYSETHETDVHGVDSRLGCVYPLREGEILFVGRHPAPTEVLRRDGASVRPTHSHLFPAGGLHGYISRRHLTVEMDSLGGSILTDYSRYGIYLEKARKWHCRKDADGPPETHRVAGEEAVILMDALGKPTDRDLVERRSRYRLQILRSPRLADRDPLTETRP